jgi:hypothetical protein
VFQAAMAGVQEYQRVQIESSPPEKVNGAAAADVVHMMTELVDNALAFSPPTAPVKISTKQAGDSTIVEISDGGLGIAQDVLNSLNEDLRSGGEVTPETARRMGLLVVSRIATRHGITVSLARNPRGGTTATVLLPPALLRGQQTQVLPKQRPGLSALTPAKSVLPAAVTERLTNESEPKKLPTRPEPAAPAAPAAVAAVAAFAKPAGPAAPAAPAAAAATAGPTKSDVAENQVDSINAAINAVTSALPQRAPGATRSGGAMPGAPVGSMGGSLFQRLQASGSGARPKEPELPQREPATPTVAFNAIDLTTLRNGVASPEPHEVETPEAEAPEVEAAEVEIPEVAEPAAEVEEPPAPVEDDAPQEVLAEESALDLAQTPAGSWVAASEVTAYDLLDSRSPMPEPTEDETPIFREMRSNWLTAGAGEDTWTTSEIEAGWEAAEQVAEAPTLQVSESGLPIRRPGKRLVPGGVSPAPTNVDRDPEAIRARLAAHAAGVSRGRTKAVDETVPVSSTEEGPA